MAGPDPIQAVLVAFDNFIKQSQEKGRRSLHRNRIAVLLVMSRKAQETYPLPEKGIITTGGGQVRGQSSQQVQKILEGHGISRVFLKEGGRTSRGTPSFARSFAEFLNDLAKGPLAQQSDEVRRSAFQAIEKRAVDFAREYFSAQRLAIHLSPDFSSTALVSAVLEAARERQKETPGATAEGAVAQHLVGAKLALRFPTVSIINMPYTAADEQTTRAGDFELNDAVFHVTVNPTEAVLRKCLENFRAGRRPVLLVAERKLAGAFVLAAQLEAESRIDIYGVERFVSSNLNEIAGFSSTGFNETFRRLIEIYNDRVLEAETDHSLMIKL